MPVRELFELEIEHINNEIKKLGYDVIKAFEDSATALAEKDLELARSIIVQDKEFDKKEIEINNKTFLLIAKQQPVAKDLRRLIIAVKIASDLERMADNAKNIAKSAISLGPDHQLTIPPDIGKMVNEAVKMAILALEAFETEDVSIAMQFSNLDDRIDDRYEKIVHNLLSEQALNEEEMKHIMQMAFCARYIERFADHVTNIGEAVIFLIKGESYQLN